MPKSKQKGFPMDIEIFLDIDVASRKKWIKTNNQIIKHKGGKK